MIKLTKNNGMSVLVQLTDKCQLKCPYCMASKGKTTLSILDVELIINFFCATIDTSRDITFVWHGGEPLIMGSEFFNSMEVIFQKTGRDRKSIKNVFQTNGLLIDEGYIKLIHSTNDYFLNISMDGPDEVNLKTRGISSSKYDALFSLLKQNKIPFGVAVVASNDVLKHKEEVIRYFEERNITNIGLVPYHAYPKNGHNDLPRVLYSIKKYSEIEEHVTIRDEFPPSTALSDLSFDNNFNPTILGKSLINGVVSQAFSDHCQFSSFSDGCHKYVINIASNGEIYPCPRGQNVNLWNYGNIQSNGLESWHKTTFGENPFRPSLPQECKPCQYNKLCNGGCPANAKSMNGSALNKDYYCESFKVLFDKTFDKINIALEEKLSVND